MNMSLTDPRTVGPRIRMMMPHLTPLEARVVDMMLGRRDFDETTSLKTVAEDAGVSEAMIVKITKKLGFAGFKDFRAGIVDYNRLPTAELHQELSPDDTGVEIAQKVFRTSIHALEETLSILDPEAFEKAADLIFTARQRDFYGIGGSAQIARDVEPQVPADRRADERLRRRAHDADVGGTARRGRRRGRLLAFGRRPPPSSSPWSSPAGAAPAPSR